MGRFLCEGRKLRDGALIGFHEGLDDCKAMGIITGKLEPRRHPSVDAIPIEDDNPKENLLFLE